LTIFGERRAASTLGFPSYCSVFVSIFSIRGQIHIYRDHIRD